MPPLAGAPTEFHWGYTLGFLCCSFIQLQTDNVGNVRANIFVNRFVRTLKIFQNLGATKAVTITNGEIFHYLIAYSSFLVKAIRAYSVALLGSVWDIVLIRLYYKERTAL